MIGERNGVVVAVAIAVAQASRYAVHLCGVARD